MVHGSDTLRTEWRTKALQPLFAAGMSMSHWSRDVPAELRFVNRPLQLDQLHHASKARLVPGAESRAETDDCAAIGILLPCTDNWNRTLSYYLYDTISATNAYPISDA